jgi:phosphate transport system substrate-binding protein
LFVYINAQSLERPEVKSFAEFMLANAAALSREVGYIALPDEVNQLVQARN